jgi:hypothetical protein
VADYEEGMVKDGVKCQYSDKELSVIDFTVDHVTRCLLFNTNLNFVQSAIHVNKHSGDIDLVNPLPLDTSKHIVGFSFSFLYHYLNRESAPHDSPHEVSRCAVLGAGGCYLPMLITSLFAHCTVDAIELSPSVIHVAQEYFGLKNYPNKDRITLHQDCALKWIASQHAAKTVYDIILVDICEMLSLEETHLGGSILDCRDLVSPSDETLSISTLKNLLGCLDRTGVLAINVLGNDVGHSMAVHQVTEALETIAREQNDAIAYALAIMHLPFDEEHENGKGFARKIIARVEDDTSDELDTFEVLEKSSDPEEAGEGDENSPTIYSKESEGYTVAPAESVNLDRETGSSLPRYNGTIFIVKNCSPWFRTLIASEGDGENRSAALHALSTARDNYLELYHRNLSHDAPSFPFDRPEYAVVLDEWMAKCKYDVTG